MTRWERKAALGHGGVTRVAKKVRRSMSHVSQVLNGHRRDAMVELAIASEIGRAPEDVFPPREASYSAA